ncbi:MAG: flippase-like domain-containing protein [Candidatus Bathyarchaeota archaeon]|nr:MAG: flippase-like domain-containing protein [Candidatus Bathyarchaeota archaeon]
MKGKAAIILLAGLLIYIVFLFFFMDVGAIIRAIQQANLVYYLLAFLASLMNVLFFSLTWWRLLRTLSIKTTFWKIFSFTWVGKFIDILIPAESVSGEITRAYLMNKDSNGNIGGITASIISHRVINTIISFGGFMIGAIVFNLRHEVGQLVKGLIVTIMIGAMASIIFLIILCMRKKLAFRIANSLLGLLHTILRGRWSLKHLKQTIPKILDSFYDGIKILRYHPTSFFLPIAFSIAAWVSKLLIVFFVFISLGVEVPLSAIMVVFAITDTLQTIPLGIPGEVGVTEITMTVLYTAIGVPSIISATATILTRIVTMWFKLLVGGGMAQWVLHKENVKFNQVSFK